MIKSPPVTIFLLLSISLAFGQKTYHAKKVTDGDRPALSPDGKQIAIVQAGRLSVFTYKGKLIRNVGSRNWDSEPAWSPDGRKIAFASYGPKRFHSKYFAIWIVNADGTDLHMLAVNANSHSGDQFPRWSPDGTKITWTHGNQLWIADSSGLNAHPLTDAPAASSSGFNEFCGVWSPDSKTIAFLRSGDYGTYGYRLFLIDADGKNERSLGDLRAYFLLWSRKPQILFYSDGSVVMQLNIVTLHSSLCYSFEIADVPVGWFSLSSDEKLLAYDTSAPEVDAEVMIDTFGCLEQ